MGNDILAQHEENEIKGQANGRPEQEFRCHCRKLWVLTQPDKDGWSGKHYWCRGNPDNESNQKPLTKCPANLPVIIRPKGLGNQRANGQGDPERKEIERLIIAQAK